MSYNFHTDIRAKSISYGGSRKASDIKYIVIHYTGNNTDKSVSNAKFFRDGNTRSAGAHYFVDDIDVYESIDPLKIAYAVGGKYTSSISGGGTMYGKITNANSLSIEMCSTNGKISDKTFENTVELTRKLMAKYNIKDTNVYRHWDVNQKSCPGWTGWLGKDASIWKKFKSKISGIEEKKDLTYKITYKLDGGTNNASNPATFKSSVSVSLKDPTKSGYVFKGWYTDSTYKTKVTEIAKGTKNDVTLYAKWEKKEEKKSSLKATVKTNGGQLSLRNKSVNIIGYIPNGATVKDVVKNATTMKISGTSYTMAQCTYNGKTGYVAQKFLKF